MFLANFLIYSCSSPKRRCFHRRCRNQALIAVARASRSMSVNMVPPDTRAAAIENIILEPVPALPPTPGPLPTPLASAPTPGPLVDMPLADTADTCNTVPPPAKRTRKAKLRCKWNYWEVRTRNVDYTFLLSPVSPAVRLTCRQHCRRHE